MNSGRKAIAFLLSLVMITPLILAPVRANDIIPRITSVTEKDYLSLNEVAAYESGERTIAPGITLTRHEEKAPVTLKFAREAHCGTLTLVTRSQSSYLMYIFEVADRLGTSLTLPKSVESVHYSFTMAPEGGFGAPISVALNAEIQHLEDSVMPLNMLYLRLSEIFADGSERQSEKLFCVGLGSVAEERDFAVKGYTVHVRVNADNLLEECYIVY